MALNARTLLSGLVTAVLAYFVLTAPASAAEFTRGLLDQLAISAASGITFLQHLGT